jgi:hypothetical protein
MSRRKSIACRENKIAASSSSSDADDHESLGADQEQAHAFTYDVGSSSAMPQRRGGSLHNRIHLLASTRPSGRTTFQCKFVLLS